MCMIYQQRSGVPYFEPAVSNAERFMGIWLKNNLCFVICVFTGSPLRRSSEIASQAFAERNKNVCCSH